MARASLLEAQNHLDDAVDRGLINDSLRREHEALARTALRDITALMEYLQSPRALTNAAQARAHGQARRTQNSDPEI